MSTSSRPLLPSAILLSATESTCSSMAWGSTVFGVAGLVNSFEARKVVLWLLETCQQSRTGWCCVVSTRFEPTKTSQATPSVSIARLVPCFFLRSSKCGEVRIQISGGVWSSQFQACHRLGDRFLSRPPARRSGSAGAL